MPQFPTIKILAVEPQKINLPCSQISVEKFGQDIYDEIVQKKYDYYCIDGPNFRVIGDISIVPEMFAINYFDYKHGEKHSYFPSFHPFFVKNMTIDSPIIIRKNVVLPNITKAQSTHDILTEGLDQSIVIEHIPIPLFEKINESQ